MIISGLIKELRLLSRDLHGVAVLFIMPITFILIMSLALSDADNAYESAEIALVGNDQLSLNKALINSIHEQSRIRVTSYPSTSLAEAQKALDEGAYTLLLVNPNESYSTTLTDDQPLELQMLASTNKQRLLGIKGSIQKAYTQQRLQLYFDDHAKEDRSIENSNKLPKKVKEALDEAIASAQPDLPALESYLSAEQLTDTYLNSSGSHVTIPNSAQQSVPAWLIFGMFFIMIPLSNVMAEERNTNTIVRLRMARAAPLTLLISKMIPYFLINQIQFIAMILLGIYGLPLLGITGLELSGPWYNYSFLAIAVSLSALGYGVLISVISKSTEHAVIMGGGGNIIMAAIGGIMVPSYVMPESMQKIAQISPMSWALEGFHNLLLNQQSLVQILPIWSALIGFAVFFLTIAYFIYRKQLLGAS